MQALVEIRTLKHLSHTSWNDNLRRIRPREQREYQDQIDWSDAAFDVNYSAPTYFAITYRLDENDDGTSFDSAARWNQAVDVLDYYYGRCADRLWTLFGIQADKWLVKLSDPEWIHRLRDSDLRRDGGRPANGPRRSSRIYNRTDPSCALRALLDPKLYNAKSSDQLRNIFVRELIEWRNRWAHKEYLGLAEITRIADTMWQLTTLVEQINDPDKWLYEDPTYLESGDIRRELKFHDHYLELRPVVVLGRVETANQVPGSSLDGLVSPTYEYSIKFNDPSLFIDYITAYECTHEPIAVGRWVEVDVSHVELRQWAGAVREYKEPVDHDKKIRELSAKYAEQQRRRNKMKGS